ncbi:MAG: hypothetical protein BIFFINMI_01074 [Phycisphaerae bacterium]|nr:hypothetical protein [Phycisphaerae bacterium]
MNRRIGWIGAAALALSAGVALAEEPGLPAFPGAEGFGAAAVGGRGGKVVHVTNLNAKGPGSLQEALDLDQPRIIVFDVSGVIEGNVNLSKPNVTIAGQTAPGAGITVQGRLSSGIARGGQPLHDVIIRHIRFRPVWGEVGGGNGDCTQLNAITKLILDHVSVSGGNDEEMDFCVSHDLTVQWCTIEASCLAHQGSGVHNYGMILGYVDGAATLHHNLFAHQSERAPLCGLDTVDHRNNVLYNVAWALQYHPPRMNRHEGRLYHTNLIGDYFKAGPGGPVGMRPWLLPYNQAVPGLADWKNVQLYGHRNFWAWAGPEGRYDDYDPNVQASDGIKKGSKFWVEKEWDVPAVATQDAKEAYRLVLAQAGCLPRDAVTRRTIEETRTGTGSWGWHPPAGGLMEGMTPGKPAADADGDGMPDDWEKAHGLNPADPADANKVVPAGASEGDRHRGYTYVEFYVNELSDKLVAAAAEDAAKRDAQPPTPEPAAPAVVAGQSNLPLPAGPGGATISAGSGDVLAIRNGKLYGWGLNWRGELGDGGGKDRDAPAVTLGPDGKSPLATPAAISAGGETSAAITADGKLLAWGSNDHGQLGNGQTAEQVPLPVSVLGPDGKAPLDRVVAVSVGGYHTLILRADGTVWATGCGQDGRLGDGETADRLLPVQVKGLASAVAISAGVKHSVALRKDGTVFCWGDNLYGQLGDGTNADRLTPVQTPGLANVAAVAAGWQHTLALAADGTVWAWGCNDFGQLGDGTTVFRNRPVQVRTAEGRPLIARTIAAGGLHSLAIDRDGGLWAWGWNYRGQCGVGSHDSLSVATRVKGPLGVGLLEKVAAVAGGGAHTVAMLADGSLLTWGDNMRGQIGDGSLNVKWIDKDGNYVDQGKRSTSEMIKTGHRVAATRWVPRPVPAIKESH